MSFFDTLKADFHKLFGHEASYLHLAIAAISFGAPVVELIVADSDPKALPVVQPLITRIESGLAVAYELANEGASSTSTLASRLTLVQSDLESVEEVAGIKSATTKAKVAALLAEIGQVLTLIQQERGSGASGSGNQTQSPAPAKPAPPSGVTQPAPQPASSSTAAPAPMN